MNFSLPLGAFQIQLAVPGIISAVRHLQEVLEEFYTLWESAFAENSGNLDVLSKSIQDIADSSINNDIKEAEGRLEQSLVSEFPDVLPEITKQLILASIVAQALHLSFEVTDYELNKENDKELSYWWVTGRIMDKHGRLEERYGTSFMFNKNDEKMAEGALLSACADAFIHCMHSVFPYFPWDRWDEAWKAGLDI